MAIQNIITELRSRADQLESVKDPEKQGEIVRFILFFMQLAVSEAE